MNKFEQVFSDDYQMSVAGEGRSRCPGPMSREGHREGVGIPVPCPGDGEGVGTQLLCLVRWVGTVRSNASWVVVTCKPSPFPNRTDGQTFPHLHLTVVII